MTHAAERVSEHVWRVPVAVATLPPYDHTNAYVIADGGVGLVVDPGSPLAASTDAIASALGEAGVRLVKGIVLTHGHPDHWEGLAAALERFDAPSVYVHAAEAERVAVDARKVLVTNDVVITVGDLAVELIHTPGHSPGHLSAVVRPPHGPPEAALAGDLVAATGSVWVGKPEGDVGAYLASLERLIAVTPPVLGTGHGPVVTDPVGRLKEQRAHRLEREEQVLRALQAGPLDASAVTRTIYPGADGQLRDLARLSVLAHLDKLEAEGRVRRLGDGDEAPFALA
ncbi:MAG TPA: MBL fold metallo-hydrolase [Trueperaceae bacterium]